ncbi:MAG: mechanosensitive ion channel family protein [Chitinophagaceae bacterium]
MDFSNAYQLISHKLFAWLHELVRMIPNLVLAAIVLAIGLLMSRVIRRVAGVMMKKVTHNKAINQLFASILYFSFIGITFFVVLSILKLDKAVTSILAGAGLLGLALAFAFQDIAANFISGIFISFRKPFHTGDIVQLKNYMGKVEDINLRDTVLRTFQGQMVIIPNKDVFQNPIENFSILGKRRMDLTIGVSYGEDLELVKKVTLEAVRDLPDLSDEDPTTLFFLEFADSSINFVIRLWVKSPEQKAWLETGSEAIIRIKKAYEANDILIPFPIRTIDFGIKGGISLKEELKEKNLSH